ncbi:hypothetical protein Cgig2_024645 [Carnegiea gigantea]|uniref:Cytochrome P450 n=1 Tax=Carnegiea gigantea TaxID=171969 RepID=A0A9Q1QEG2_9CARY|nr:hypothetical protein Cgig2_024645 [Carnegiea gigantea]
MSLLQTTIKNRKPEHLMPKIEASRSGHKASSIALLVIRKNPSVENKIVQEIVQTAGKRVKKRKDRNFEVIFDTQDLEKMSPCLVPVDFKEAKEDEVFYRTYAMGRMDSIWGEDCMEFQPKNEKGFKYAWLNGGPRLCVGKKFADLQMMVAASILLRYRVKVWKIRLFVLKSPPLLHEAWVIRWFCA